MAERFFRAREEGELRNRWNARVNLERDCSEAGVDREKINKASESSPVSRTRGNGKKFPKTLARRLYWHACQVFRREISCR